MRRVLGLLFLLICACATDNEAKNEANEVEAIPPFLQQQEVAEYLVTETGEPIVLPGEGAGDELKEALAADLETNAVTYYYYDGSAGVDKVCLMSVSWYGSHRNFICDNHGLVDEISNMEPIYLWLDEGDDGVVFRYVDGGAPGCDCDCDLSDFNLEPHTAIDYVPYATTGARLTHNINDTGCTAAPDCKHELTGSGDDHLFLGASHQDFTINLCDGENEIRGSDDRQKYQVYYLGCDPCLIPGSSCYANGDDWIYDYGSANDSYHLRDGDDHVVDVGCSFLWNNGGADYDVQNSCSGTSNYESTGTFSAPSCPSTPFP